MLCNGVREGGGGALPQAQQVVCTCSLYLLHCGTLAMFKGPLPMFERPGLLTGSAVQPFIITPTSHPCVIIVIHTCGRARPSDKALSAALPTSTSPACHMHDTSQVGSGQGQVRVRSGSSNTSPACHMYDMSGQVRVNGQPQWKRAHSLRARVTRS